jgi:hypothetical protein
MIVSTWTRPLLALVSTFVLLACYASPPSEQEMDSVSLEVKASKGVVESLPPSVKGGNKCGNGKCQKGETCSNCEADCGACPPVCGNGTCEAGETCSNCAADCGPCGPVCGNGTCEAGETCGTCQADCGPCGPVCGNGTCEAALGENPCNCPTDCPNDPNLCEACECGGQGGPFGSCYCDDSCMFVGDCCDNACMVCGFGCP